MSVSQIIIIVLAMLCLLNIILIIAVLSGKKGSSDDRSMKEEFSMNRRELIQTFNALAKSNREELASSMKSFSQTTTASLDKMNATVERKLNDLQRDNGEKLDKMRETVDEKLQKTLETRLGQSFKLVSERLEQVQKGLGEMQSLASDVGGLKRVLSNVKTKGVFGEYQLDAILDEVMSPSQYARNVKPIPGKNTIVEFAIKIPSKDDSQKTVWLPVDAKFPTEDYERLMSAYETGNADEIAANTKALQSKIIIFAKEIHSKYIEPPYTTDFAIMYLPFEGLYAEVLRIPGLFEQMQRDWKITIAGPTTISAFLNSLQLGFRSLAIEKRTSEVWNLLGAVRTEFGKFGDVLEKTKERLDLASKEIDNAGLRSRQIEKKLKNVELMPGTSASTLLDNDTSD